MAVKIGNIIEAQSARTVENVSLALFNKGITLGQLGRSEEAIAVYDEVVRRFGEASERRCASEWPVL